ncbi:MAG: hypothetical protein HY751_11705 [Nitrospinae bacterium]|nr:hypothetical protein [Nitrospinota bacterium]
MKLNILGVSLFNGQFRAATYHRGEQTGYWELPDPVTDQHSLGRAITQAVSALSYKGIYISFVMEDEAMDHLFIQAPELSAKDLKIFLARKVVQEKPGANLLHSYTKAKSPKGGLAILAYTLEKDFLTGLLFACEELKLTPLQIYPIGPVMARQLTKLKMEPNEMVGLVTATADKLALVVGKADGSVLFERFLDYDESEGADLARTGRELNRSILFAKQQFGAAADRVLFFGDFTADFIEQVSAQIDVPSQPAQVEMHKGFWIGEALRIPPHNESNLVPRDVQRRPMRAKMLKATAAMVVGIWIVCLGAMGFIEYMIVASKKTLGQARLMAAGADEEEKVWRARVGEYLDQKNSLALFNQSRIHPAPGWIASHMGVTTPEGLALTKLVVEMENGGWSVKIEGVTEKSHSETAVDLKNMEESLAHGPYHMKITKSWRDKWIEDLKKGVGGPGAKRQFQISGVVK